MASATGVRPAAGLGDAGFFFPFFLSLLFSFGFVLFFGAGRTGKARRKLLESSRGITIPYPCSPPCTVGAALAFLHPPALLQDLRQQSPNPPWLQALPEPPGECGWRSLSVPPGGARGRAQPGSPRLSPSCAQGRAPAGDSPERSSLAAAPRRFAAAAVVPSANLSLWINQSRVPGGARAAGRASPADAAQAPGGSARAKRSSQRVPGWEEGPASFSS